MTCLGPEHKHKFLAWHKSGYRYGFLDSGGSDTIHSDGTQVVYRSVVVITNILIETGRD